MTTILSQNMAGGITNNTCVTKVRLYDEIVKCYKGYAVVKNDKYVPAVRIRGFPVVITVDDLPQNVWDHFVKRGLLDKNSREQRKSETLPSTREEYMQDTYGRKGRSNLNKKPKKVLSERICKCGCGDAFMPTSHLQLYIKGHNPNAKK